MDNSFFEYRDKTKLESDSDSEFIDNSLVEDVLFSAKKKNKTVFVAESEESTDDDYEADNSRDHLPKTVNKDAGVTDVHVISSCDEDASRKGSIRRHTQSDDNVVLSSSGEDSSEEAEEEVSPELIPKRRPLKPKSIDPDESIIGRKTKKRMFLLDSDTDNSIVVEHKSHRKLTCLKDTPIKTDSKVNKDVDKSMDYDDESSEDDDESDDQSDEEDEKSSIKNDNKKSNLKPNTKSKVENNKSKSKENSDPETCKVSNKYDCNFSKKSHDGVKNSDDDIQGSDYDSVSGSDGDVKGSNDDKKGSDDDKKESDDDVKGSDDNDDGPDEDLMVMSRATRMSIMGIIPKDVESDDSDFIESDESSRKSKDSIANSVSDLPDPGFSVPKTQDKSDLEADTSRLTCSPIVSPLRDITNELNKSSLDDKTDVIDLSNADFIPMSNKVVNRVRKENLYDDLAIIETKPEIIALSSDDEDYELKVVEKKPRGSSKSPKSDDSKSEREARAPPDIKEYMLPPSRSNQVVYVKKHVRENELDKLRRLQEDLHSVRLLLDEMDLQSLPDGGSKLIQRFSGLEAEVRRQGDKVANMVVEPDEPTAQDIAKDGFDKGLSWADIEKANNAVQPRMFGKQAMQTHMAERNLIIDRLRDFHESLGSRPAESALATSPRLVSSQLMPHQLHALAWLQWRETQRPSAGILADDMGLGKTITMIALVASDKEGKIDHDDDDDYDPPAKGKLVRGGTLVVCPASLIQQWAGEVKKHCSAHALSVCLHHGAARAVQPHRLAPHDVVATTYNILQRDCEKNGVLMRVAWRRVILDEAHIVRNHKSATSMAVCGLRARRRWCLTGTPVQNKDLDLFALLKFLRCSPFDELQMWKKWIDNKSQGGQERLSTIMRCILLRRTKVQLQARGQLACLPARAAHHTEVTLSAAEMNVYQKLLILSKSLFAQFLHQRAEKNSDSVASSRQQDSEYYKMHRKMVALKGVKPVKSHEILVLLLRLRQVCCHCGLVAALLEGGGAHAPDAGAEDLLQELDKLSLDESSTRRKNGHNDGEDEDIEDVAGETTAADAIRSALAADDPVFQLDRPSSKIRAAMDCLNDNVFPNQGDKAVVVSQWTSVLRLVEAELKGRRVRSVTLSGAVPVPARAGLIDTFNDPRSDVRVMLLSLCAGGVGINLCGANHLLLLDPHWNPQLEEQAQDRIYRVGQKKDVHIYRFMCVGTVEQSIRKLQEKKLKLAENVLTGAKNTGASTLSIEDLKTIFNMAQ